MAQTKRSRPYLPATRQPIKKRPPQSQSERLKDYMQSQQAITDTGRLVPPRGATPPRAVPIPSKQKRSFRSILPFLPGVTDQGKKVPSVARQVRRTRRAQKNEKLQRSQRKGK